MIWNLILFALAAWFFVIGVVNAAHEKRNAAAYCIVVELILVAIIGIRLT